MTLLILGIVAAGLDLIYRRDRYIEVPGWGRAVLLLAALAGAALASGILQAVVVGCLLLACVTDLAMCRVYNFVWWAGGLAAGLCFLTEAGEDPALFRCLWEWALFCCIQMTLFARFYGRADCYAFCVCAGAEAAMGGGMAGYLLHMLFSLCLLGAVQAVRKNISPRGDLKRPVPFLPYITAVFYLFLFVGNRIM